MALHINTKHLVEILTDLAHTAADPAVGGATAAILLHTARGDLKDEPGKTDLLVGTSTDGVLVGHTFTDCYGQIRPMLWPIASVKDVIAVLKPKAKEKDHAVDIIIDLNNVTVAEDPNLFEDGLRLTFTSLDPADFPTVAVNGLLTSTRTVPAYDDAPPAAPRFDFPAWALAPFVKVASRRKEPLEMYPHHQRLPVALQVGLAYRGVVRPARWDDENVSAGMEPGGDVYPLALDDVDA